ncbi:hypothetical protein [Hymenobacter metallicola]|uniref:Uncharacterized protein n=1 Tax=Hymenobacter metallicola TaxID=2563114 RepID=A0A4Z0QH58_9BACT|nr:hypothetical protein [Hymenobacter metallicola]TGE28371.1 hypothetical protein E5K02_02585 [Hymenobacter metallicola]
MSSTSATVTIQLQSADLRYILSLNQQIIIVRSLKNEGNYVVACYASVPVFPTTTLQFGPNWYVFAAPVPSAFDQLPQLPTTAQVVDAGTVYTFSAGIFGQQQPAYSPTVFGCDNTVAQPIGFGVAQDLGVNGVPAPAPLAIMEAPTNQTSYLEPIDEIKIFLASNLTVGQVLPAALLTPIGGSSVNQRGGFSVGQYLAVPLTQDVTVGFNSASNSFVRTSLLGG